MKENKRKLVVLSLLKLCSLDAVPLKDLKLCSSSFKYTIISNGELGTCLYFSPLFEAHLITGVVSLLAVSTTEAVHLYETDNEPTYSDPCRSSPLLLRSTGSETGKERRDKKNGRSETQYTDPGRDR